MVPEGPTTLIINVGYLVLALVVIVVIAGVYYQRRLIAKQGAIQTKDYFDEKQWDDPEWTPIDTRTVVEIKEYSDMREWGTLNPSYTCPYCDKKGFTRSKSVRRRKKMDAARETGVVLKEPWSLKAAGLTEEEERAQAHCGNCGATWDV